MADISKETKNGEKCKLVTWQKNAICVCVCISIACCLLACVDGFHFQQFFNEMPLRILGHDAGHKNGQQSQILPLATDRSVYYIATDVIVDIRLQICMA